MNGNQLTLSENWINYLVNLPETGMGYQLVKIILKGGKVLPKHRVINSSILVLEGSEDFEIKDILKIEIDE